MLRKELRRLVLLFGFLGILFASHAQYTVRGGDGTPLMAAENTDEHLKVYLVNGMNGIEISYTSSSTSHRWYRYKNKALESEPVRSTQNGTTSTITDVEEGYGYFVEEASAMSTYYVWIIDYDKNAFDIRSLQVGVSDPCSSVLLTGDADVSTMVYYTPMKGIRTVLERQFEVSFSTLSWMSEAKYFMPKDTTILLEGHPFQTSFNTPLTDTPILLRGDLFARHFGREKSMITDEYSPVAVKAYMDTTYVDIEYDNMNSSRPGVSAPTTIVFTAHANEPVAAHYLWKIVLNGMDTLRRNEPEMEYTFNRAGSYKVILEVTDRTSTCTDETNMIEFTIAESFLEVPNAFSPGTTPGINDEFKVAYKSLVRFKGWIFNRWGVQLFHWTNPAQGWDGKYKGKYVTPGAYFYIIEAEGSEGLRYKEKGHVNVLRPKTIDDEVIERE